MGGKTLLRGVWQKGPAHSISVFETWMAFLFEMQNSVAVLHWLMLKSVASMESEMAQRVRAIATKLDTLGPTW